MQWVKHEIAKWELDGLFVACAGGHGRTGTFLTIYGVLAKLLTSSDPVAELRGKYCERVVETQIQITYLKQLGIRTRSKPAGFGYVPVVSGTPARACYAYLLTQFSFLKCSHDCCRGDHVDDWHWCKKCKLDWNYDPDTDTLRERLIDQGFPDVRIQFRKLYPLNTERVTPFVKGIYFTEPPIEAKKESLDTTLLPYCKATTCSPDQQCQHTCGFLADHVGVSHYCSDCKSTWFSTSYAGSTQTLIHKEESNFDSF